MVETITFLDLDQRDDIFSSPIDPSLDRFIDGMVDLIVRENMMPLVKNKRLVREFILYGFMRATGYGMKTEYSDDDSYDESHSDERILSTSDFFGFTGKFNSRNDVLAIADFGKNVYIRGDDIILVEDGEQLEGGVYQTLSAQGYEESERMPVPHTNWETYLDEPLEHTFHTLFHVNRQMKQKSWQRREILYQARDPSLPRIEIENRSEDIILIPGNLENVVRIE